MKWKTAIGLPSFYRTGPQNHSIEMHPILQDKGKTTLKVIWRSSALPPSFQQARQWPPGAVGHDSCLVEPGSPKGGTALEWVQKAEP